MSRRASSSSKVPSAVASAPATMPPGATQSIGSSLADVLRERIANGVYPPGTWIRESAIAEEFDYSNGPIREALQLLVSEELLVREPWRGVKVTELSGEEIVEIFQLRGALLELAAELAAHHISADQLKHAKQMLKKLDVAVTRGDIEEQMALGHALSLWLCDASGNARLARSFNRLTLQTRMYTHVSLVKRVDKGEIGKPWYELLDALERRDVADASKAT